VVGPNGGGNAARHSNFLFCLIVTSEGTKYIAICGANPSRDFMIIHG
jgi:hypothetical protein